MIRDHRRAIDQHPARTTSSCAHSPQDEPISRVDHSPPSHAARPQSDLPYGGSATFASSLSSSSVQSLIPLEASGWSQVSLSPPFSSPPLQQRKRLRSKVRPQEALMHAPSLPCQSADYQQRHTSSGGCDGDSDSDASDSAQGEGSTPLREVGLASPGKGPPKKRQRAHLDPDDVGRFAGMSILEDAARKSVWGSHGLYDANDANGPRPPPSSPMSPLLPRLSSPYRGAAVSSAALQHSTRSVNRDTIERAVEDVHMGKGASSWNIDPHRTFVASLEEEEDNTSDVQAAGVPRSEGDPLKTEAITQAEAQEFEAWKQVRKTRNKGEEMCDDDLDEGSLAKVEATFAINPELLAKLDAHSRAAALSGDISNRPAAGSRPPGIAPADITSQKEDTKGALVIWRSPQDILGPCGTSDVGEGKSETMPDKKAPGHRTEAFAALSSSSPLTSINYSTGEASSSQGHSRQDTPFSFGVASPSQGFAPCFCDAKEGGHDAAMEAQITSPEDETMDLDD